MLIKALACILCLCLILHCTCTVPAAEEPSGLYAKYAALLDADSGRVLFEKNGYTPAANASTTKILTCLIALEKGNPDDIVTVSPYAATMPDVQLNIVKGQQFTLQNLLYSLMLQSHNDTAVAIAEHIAANYLDSGFANTDAASRSKEDSLKLVSVFADTMNQYARNFGCTDTHFITPNGLDADDEEGFHSTTAVDLAKIMSHCIQNEQFLAITQTQNCTFQDVTGKKTYSLHNTNAFFSMMDGVLSGKTGFTGKAGYCYVCALQSEGRTFISVVLASGWPGNKTYKWKDTRKILDYAKSEYFNKTIRPSDSLPKKIAVNNGIADYAESYCSDAFTLLLSDSDIVNVVYELPECLEAPVYANQTLGSANIYINDVLYKTVLIKSMEPVDKTNPSLWQRLKQRLHL